VGALYARSRLFICIGIQVLLYIFLFAYEGSIWVGHAVLGIIVTATALDVIILNVISRKISGSRKVNDKLSLSDSQYVKYAISNDSNISVRANIIDELPAQLQQRSFLFETRINKQTTYHKDYNIRPVIRGLYKFGKLHVYYNSTAIGLLDRRISFDIDQEVPVYPSFIQMKQYELQVFNKVATMSGIRRVRRIGKTDEFEHIKNYTQGDQIKSINWKATSRKGELMINQYQDTRSQSIYCIIDKGRSMKMPFEKLALLDYSINSALVLSNIILKKYDRAGIITFNESIDTIIKSDNKQGQISVISQALYNQQTGYKESNYQSLFFHISNFENAYDMRRALPYLRQLNKLHLLVVIFFTNTELVAESQKQVEKLSDIYSTTFARKALIEKDLIAEEMLAHGIQSMLTTPNELSLNVINKYLEIKAKRMI